MNILSNQKNASLKDVSNQLLIRFNATSNETRLWLIQLYQSYLENPQPFTILCIDNCSISQGAYRADIAADLRDELPDRLLDQFLQNIFYYRSNCSNIEDCTQELKGIIQQLKQERNLLT
ncbi:hypothetical protein [Planktothricoides raciborskii]|uniref:Uncharacterized protein n=1 Tax=Planktothricoides raciborskii FACHB-1370 TaxID=2949576 RepID=A0ABR8EED0_9CYAN|nr:hypothetical protein [Planktothricoides raciborskii]MBD2544484.1 hypothetical protein [Planktothricoides raciborskii FACHB-1370]MBD2585964.1 hypothetical protein [Planktothricoides raciborskii FACHB-1261]